MDGLKQAAPPVTRTMRTRHWFRPYCTRSWQAGYNLACAYAAVAQAQHQAKGADQSELPDLTIAVVSSLWFTVCNPECEMERPWDWICHDPDFSFMHRHGKKANHNKANGQDAFAAFREFLDLQERRDYPPAPVDTGPALCHPAAPDDQPSGVLRPA